MAKRQSVTCSKCKKTCSADPSGMCRNCGLPTDADPVDVAAPAAAAKPAKGKKSK